MPCTAYLQEQQTKESMSPTTTPCSNPTITDSMCIDVMQQLSPQGSTQAYRQAVGYPPITVISDSVVIVDFQALQILDQTPLEVSTAGGLDCGVNQTISPCHAMEVVLLGTESCQKPVTNEATGPSPCRAAKHLDCCTAFSCEGSCYVKS